MHLTKGTTKGSCGEAAGLGTKKKPPDSDFFTSLKTHEYLLKIDGWDRKMIYVLLKKVSLRHVYFRGCISLLGNRSKKWRKWHFVGQWDRFVPFVNAAFVAFQSAIDYVCRRPRPVASLVSQWGVGRSKMNMKTMMWETSEAKQALPSGAPSVGKARGIELRSWFQIL